MIYSFVKYRDGLLKKEYLRPKESDQDCENNNSDKPRWDATSMSTLVDEKVHFQPKITSLWH
jgi:hypothetical protein